jgi:proteasome lid subunit RPN8/RPN11
MTGDAPASKGTDTVAAPRRSSRERRAPAELACDADRPSPDLGNRRGATRPAKTNPAAAAIRRVANGNREAETDRLEQTAPLIPGVSEGAPTVQPYHVVVHPCASSLMHLHAHMAETEVIGYLAGVVVRSGNTMHDETYRSPNQRAASVATIITQRQNRPLVSEQEGPRVDDSFGLTGNGSVISGTAYEDVQLAAVVTPRTTTVPGKDRQVHDSTILGAASSAASVLPLGETCISNAEETLPSPAETKAETTIYIMEAFPALCVEAKVLARTGRDALSEVEMDPESDVDVRTRIAEKGMSVVGWYHSHPFFSTDPSEVDVENQHNYQTLLFGGAPYVAAICTPYWECLPDWRGKLDFFYVSTDNLYPIALDYTNSTSLPPVSNPTLRNYYATASSLTIAPAAAAVSNSLSVSSSTSVTGTCIDARILSYQLASLESEAINLISQYSQYAKRIDLLAYWRDRITCLEKLRRALCDHDPPTVPEGAHSSLLRSVAKSSVAVETDLPSLSSVPPPAQSRLADAAAFVEAGGEKEDLSSNLSRQLDEYVLTSKPHDDGQVKRNANGPDICKRGTKGLNKVQSRDRDADKHDSPATSFEFIDHPCRAFPVTPELDNLLASVVEQVGAAWIVAGNERDERAAAAAKRKRAKRRKRSYF